MPRAKPSEWQPKGSELFDTHDLYSDDDLAKLVEKFFMRYREKEKRKILVQVPSRFVLELSLARSPA